MEASSFSMMQKTVSLSHQKILLAINRDTGKCKRTFIFTAIKESFFREICICDNVSWDGVRKLHSIRLSPSWWKACKTRYYHMCHVLSALFSLTMFAVLELDLNEVKMKIFFLLLITCHTFKEILSPLAAHETLTFLWSDIERWPVQKLLNITLVAMSRIMMMIILGWCTPWSS